MTVRQWLNCSSQMCEKQKRVAKSMQILSDFSQAIMIDDVFTSQYREPMPAVPVEVGPIGVRSASAIRSFLPIEPRDSCPFWLTRDQEFGQIGLNVGWSNLFAIVWALFLRERRHLVVSPWRWQAHLQTVNAVNIMRPGVTVSQLSNYGE